MILELRQDLLCQMLLKGKGEQCTRSDETLVQNQK